MPGMDTPHTPDPVLDADAELPAPRTGAEIPTLPDVVARVRTLADALGHVTESDFCELAGIRASTAEAWRKRHTGPAYVILGNRIMYPIDGLRVFLEGLRRGGRVPDARKLL